MKKNYITLVLASMFAFTAVAQDVVLWGGKGSKAGEFDGGLNGWTTKGVKSADATKSALAVWKWSKDANAVGAFGTAANTKLASASAANGAVAFNSDSLDNNGNSALIGKGGCPAPHISELISPTIDLKTEPNITLVFSQLYRNFQSKAYIMYSKDDGKTWTQVNIIANEAATVNKATSATAVVNRVQLPGAGGTDKFKFKFVFDGNYYYWVIDDVAIVRQEDINLRTNANFFTIPENVRTPIGQTRPQWFVNDIANLGAEAAKNVKHKLVISQGAKAVYADSLTYATFPKDSTIENKLFAKSFTPLAKDTYTGIYSISSDGTDAEPDNNSLQFQCLVNDSTFSKDLRRTGNSRPSFAAGADHIWSYGNSFYVAKGGSNYKATSVEFGINNAAAVKGEILTAYLYEWEDTNADTNMTFSELKILGIKEYTVIGTEPAPTATLANLIKVPLENFDDAKKPIIVKSNTTYVVMLESNTTGKPADLLISTCDDLDYAATSTAMELKGIGSFSDVLKVGDAFYSGGFSGKTVPMVRLNIPTPTVGVEDVKLAETTVSVGPNPSTDYINVNFDFATLTKNIDVKVTDNNGRTVLAAQYNNIQKDNVTLYTNNLAAGTYQMHIVTENGVTTKSFVVAR